MNFIDTLAGVNKNLRLKRLLNIILVSLVFILCLWLFSSIWSFFKPDHFYQSLLVGAVASLVLNAYLISLLKKTVINSQDLLLHLEMKHDHTGQPAFELIDQKPDDFWQGKLLEYKSTMLAKQKNKTGTIVKRLAKIVFALALTFCFVPGFSAFSENFYDKWVASFFIQTHIEVLRGSKDGEDNKKYVLTYLSRPKIELYADNILKITLKDKYTIQKSKVPIVSLQKTASKLSSKDNSQSFQMTRDSSGVSQAEFSVDEDAKLYVDALSAMRAVAVFKVAKVPVPEIQIKALADLKEDWYDDKPLPIQIEAIAHEPLDHIKLKIISNNKKDEEMVSKFMNNESLKFKTTYDLTLESYLEEDLAEVEVYAEAVDKSPQKYMGRSNSILIKTSSAYGRYKKTLGFLASLKSKVEESLKDKNAVLPADAMDLVKKAQRQALTTPFFDRFDRFTIDDLATLTNTATKSAEVKYSLSETLGEFLFEHEMLDDRERDRDFFIAMRHLSYKIASKKKIDDSIESDYKQLQKFISQREFRWGLRVQRLENPQLKMWSKVKEHLFKKRLSSVEGSHKKTEFAAAKKTVVATVNQYEKWLKQLEAAEDKFVEQQEKKAQQGLSDAKKTLKELQRLQGEVSKGLDQSKQADMQKLKSNWSILKMKQQSNLKKTSNFKEKLRALSPLAGNRISLAEEAMQRVLETGGEQDFVNAESNSDIASRLLRQAENSASRESKRKKSRGRRRRVGNDKYYGKTVVGGDVRVRYEYQVDSRYREDILQQVEDSDIAPEDVKIVEDYIKTIVR